MTALALAVVLAAPAADPVPKFTPEAQKELKKLEGKWRVAKVVGADGEIDTKDRELFFTFEGNKLEMSAGDKDTKENYDITALDPATDPRCIDLSEKRAGRPDRTVEGVFKIDGDTLRFAFAIPRGEKQRPVGFDKPTDPRIIVFTLKRVKD
jgi:uncharacterized protein (TIGR03067 family)